jgi:hypothetical protein
MGKTDAEYVRQIAKILHMSHLFYFFLPSLLLHAHLPPPLKVIRVEVYMWIVLVISISSDQRRS